MHQAAAVEVIRVERAVARPGFSGPFTQVTFRLQAEGVPESTFSVWVHPAFPEDKLEAVAQLEFMFRNSKIDAKYKPARFHIILAARIIASGYEVPHIGANKMEAYCQTIMKKLWADPEQLLEKAVQAVGIVAGDNFDRDNIRTEQFTAGVISHLKSL